MSYEWIDRIPRWVVILVVYLLWLAGTLAEVALYVFLYRSCTR